MAKQVMGIFGLSSVYEDIRDLAYTTLSAEQRELEAISLGESWGIPKFLIKKAMDEVGISISASRLA